MFFYNWLGFLVIPAASLELATKLVILYFVNVLDLREDKHYLADHPGLVPVTTAQV